MSSAGFSAGPAPITPNVPKFKKEEQWIKSMMLSEYTGDQIFEDVLALDDANARRLFFATFYRPLTDEKEDVALTEDMDVVGTMNFLDNMQNSPIIEAIRASVLRRRDMLPINMMMFASAYYPESLEWFRSKGYMTNRRTSRLSTKILIDLCATAGNNSLEFLGSLIGHATKESKNNAQDRADLWVCVFLLGTPEVLNGMEGFSPYKKPAVQQVLTQGPPNAVREVVRDEFPAVYEPVLNWNQTQVLDFLQNVNRLVKSKLMSPDVRRVVASLVRDVHIHALLLKDDAVVEQSSKWISGGDNAVNVITRAVSKNDKLKTAASMPEEAEPRDPLEILEVALRFGALTLKDSTTSSVQKALEQFGLTREVIQTAGYDDERLRKVVGVCFKKLSLEGGIHLRALKFAISIVTDYFKYLKTKKDSIGTSWADPTTGLTFEDMARWNLYRFRDTYFRLAAYEVVPELNKTPLEHFSSVVMAGDDSTPGGNMVFAVAARYFGIDILRNLWLSRLELGMATEMVSACDASVRNSNTPGGVVVDQILNKLKEKYPGIPSSRSTGTEAHFMIDPVRVAAADYVLNWNDNEDAWYATEVIQMINFITEQTPDVSADDPWSKTLRKLRQKKISIKSALEKMR
ncbi:MAG: hypothetical protein AB7P49_00150 [Bdellovibrionales bacterium]